MKDLPGPEMAGLSDVGRMRDSNEDAVRWDAAAGWAVLADGMGGHLAGEIASEMAVEMIASHLSAMGVVDTLALGGVLREAVGQANAGIHRRAETDPYCRNMGTTVVAVVLRDGCLSCAHVGDSRLYRFNDEGLKRLTHDHSLVQELVDEGMMTPEEAASSAHKHVITRALGLAATVEVDLIQLPAAAGDLFLLCSDGLSDALSDEVLVNLLSGDDLMSMAQVLVDEANARGGKDNISLILVRAGR